MFGPSQGVAGAAGGAGTGDHTNSDFNGGGAGGKGGAGDGNLGNASRNEPADAGAGGTEGGGGAGSGGASDEPGVCGDDKVDDGEGCDEGVENGELLRYAPDCSRIIEYKYVVLSANTLPNGDFDPNPVATADAQCRIQSPVCPRPGSPRHHDAQHRLEHLYAQASPKRALGLVQPLPQPICARLRQDGGQSAQPRCASREAAQDGAHEAKQRERPQHEAVEHRRQEDRKGPTAARAPASIRTENAPTAQYQLGPRLRIAAQQAVPDQRPGAPAMGQWGQRVSLRPSSTPASAGSSLTKRDGLGGGARGQWTYRRPRPPSKPARAEPNCRCWPRAELRRQFGAEAAKPTTEGRLSTPNSRCRGRADLRGQFGRETVKATTEGRPSTPLSRIGLTVEPCRMARTLRRSRLALVPD